MEELAQIKPIVEEKEDPHKNGRVLKWHIFKLKEFEGPLDMLLGLIKKNNINLYDIPIAEITDEYLNCLRYCEKLDLDDLTDFYATAAWLLYIKSRLLLPLAFDEADDIEDPREELVEKLIEYQKFKKLSLALEEKERDAEWIVERRKLQRSLPFDDEGLWEKMDVWDLLKSFANLTCTLSVERIMDVHEDITVNEKLTLISELLDNKKEFMFTDLLIRRGSILDIVCAFLAILDAVKSRLISIYQNRMFGDILIRKAEDGCERTESGTAEAEYV